MDSIKPNGPGENVQVISLSIIVNGRPDWTLDLTGDLTKLPRLTVQEGTEYNIRIEFVVNRELVAGLRYYEATKRKGINMSKESLMVGSYGPKKEAHIYTSPLLEFPKGMAARGTYVVNSKLADYDKNVILQWNWEYDLKKDWD